jgi:TetR/AcrR family transcriptional regulator
MPDVKDPGPSDDGGETDDPDERGSSAREVTRETVREVKAAARQAGLDAKAAAREARLEAKAAARDAARQAGLEAKTAARHAAQEASEAARRAAREAVAAARRAADPADRVRDAERSRRRILDAALGEFGDKGYEGARVREIARRAGVNAQLISYYFGGKEGLFDELIQRWHHQEAEIEQRNLPLAELAVEYLRALIDNPDLTRIFIREGLSSAPGPPWGTSREGPDAPEVDDFRRRQAAGEIAADLDPAYFLIALMGITSAPVTMPGEIERICGVKADSPEFADAFAEQLRRIVAHLGGAPRSAADGAG